MKSKYFLFIFFCFLFCGQTFSQSSDSNSPVRLDIRYSQEASGAEGSDCSAAELVLEGPFAVCPGQIIFVDLEEPNSIPDGGGQGIGFTNFDDMDFVISGMQFPYSFDSGINGILAENNIPPLEGDFLLYSVVFSNPNNVTGSICDDEWSIDVFFLSGDDPFCDQDPCYAQNLDLIGEEEVCPGETTTVATENSNTIPGEGGEGIRITNNNDINLFIADVEFPFTFDNDLNGFLSDNGMNPLEGNISFGSFVYSDADDPENSICSQSGLQFSVNFLSSIHPNCIEGDCFAQDLLAFGTSSICPTQTATVNLVNTNTVPENGGEGVRFTDGVDTDFIIPEVQFPFAFDGSLNGFLADNGLAPIEGSFQLTSVVYNDPEDIQNTICSESSGSINIEFIPGESPECLVCEAQDIFTIASFILCPGEVTTLQLLDPTSIPTGGGQGLKCTTDDGTTVFVPEITFPFQLDNDLNGFLSTNNLNPFTGLVSFRNIVYNDPTNIENTICSEGDFAATISFLPSDDISCVPCEVAELVVLGPEFVCPIETTSLDFTEEITIPEGGGVGLRVYVFDSFSALWLDDISFPYTIDNDLNGNLSANDLDLAQGWISFIPFIYVDPNDPINSTCVTGEQTDVNFLSPNNPSCQEECEVSDLILLGPSQVCGGDTTSIDIPSDNAIPTAGGLGIRLSNGDDVSITVTGTGVSFPYEFNNNSFELLIGDVLEGEFMITSFIYADPLSLNVPCSESENPVLITFLPEDDPACTLSTNEYIDSGDWNLFPNPATESFTIELESKLASTALIQIMDLQGRRIKSINRTLKPGNENIQIDINDLSQGLYQVVLNLSGTIESKLLLVKREE